MCHVDCPAKEPSRSPTLTAWLDVDAIIKATNLNLADSALHAPAAGLATPTSYPDFVDTAAMVIVRIALNTRRPTAIGAHLGLATQLHQVERMAVGTPTGSRRRREQ